MQFERIRQLRNEAGMSQARLAEILSEKTGKHYSKDAIGTYERGKTDVSTPVLVALAGTFGVSTEYLLGQTDDRRTYRVAEENSQYSPTADTEDEELTIAVLCRSKHLSQEQMKRLDGVIKAGWPELFTKRK